MSDIQKNSLEAAVDICGGWELCDSDLSVLAERAELCWAKGLEFVAVDPRDLLRLVRAVQNVNRKG